MEFQLEGCLLCLGAQIVHWLVFHLLRWPKRMNALMTVGAILLFVGMKKYVAILLQSCIY